MSVGDTLRSTLSNNPGFSKQFVANVPPVVQTSALTKSQVGKKIVNNKEKVKKRFLYQCEYCNVAFLEKRYFLEHQKKHTIKVNYRCTTCRKTFNCFRQAETHWTTECFNGGYDLPILFHCELCSRTFKSRATLFAHKLNKKHFIPKSQGNKPDKEELLSEDSDGERLVIVVDDYKFQCERCISVFDNMDELILHRTTAHDFNFVCEDCGKDFPSSEVLDKHYKRHRTLKPHVCIQCGLSFKRSILLTMHEEVHQYILPFDCPYEGCDTICSATNTFTEHNRIDHKCNISLKCDVCNIWFFKTSTYKQHMRKTIKRISRPVVIAEKV